MKLEWEDLEKLKLGDTVYGFRLGYDDHEIIKLVYVGSVVNDQKILVFSHIRKKSGHPEHFLFKRSGLIESSLGLGGEDDDNVYSSYKEAAEGIKDILKNNIKKLEDRMFLIDLECTREEVVNQAP